MLEVWVRQREGHDLPVVIRVVKSSQQPAKITTNFMINYHCLKRSNIVVKKLKIAKHQPKRDTFSKEVGANEEEDDGDEGDTDSVSTDSSICN